MRSTDNRSPASMPEFDPELVDVDEGLEQLDGEIRVLEEWLEELENRPDDPVTREARQSYQDLLRSRRETRRALARKRQSRN